jgi:hypothetical protein
MAARAPDPIVPTPASAVFELRGSRVLIGVPGHGFRGELRADNAVVRGGRTYVPVLAEHDYYRAEIEQFEVFATLAPIERVWVERISQPDFSTDVIGGLDAPPCRWPAPAEGSGSILGRRVIQTVPDGFVRDLRAVTEPFRHSDGRMYVRTCDDAAWHGWILTGAVPAVATVASELLWVE